MARRRTNNTRDRAETERTLVTAVGRVLARDGFASLGVNAIAREAGVDKVLIYRYFGGLPELLSAYAESADFWPLIEEILGGDGSDLLALPPPERASIVLVRLLEALRKRPQTIEILAWEAVQRNALTEALSRKREAWGLAISDRLSPEGDDEDLLARTALLVAGFQYLLIRSRVFPAYSGVDLASEEGWGRIRRALRASLGGAPEKKPTKRSRTSRERRSS